jgi:hypothetical protein
MPVKRSPGLGILSFRRHAVRIEHHRRGTDDDRVLGDTSHRMRVFAGGFFVTVLCQLWTQDEAGKRVCGRSMLATWGTVPLPAPGTGVVGEGGRVVFEAGTAAVLEARAVADHAVYRWLERVQGIYFSACPPE